MTFIVPAEWAPHRAIWTAWPSAADLWLEDLAPARAEVAAMILALAEGDRLKVLAHGGEAMESANAALGGKADIIPCEFGDIWLRDTGPVFGLRDNKPEAQIFRFNGWGGKYVLPHDEAVAGKIAQRAGVAARHHEFILEGGAVESNGAGTVITTRQCLLNRNRNAGWTEADAEAALKAAYSARKIIWLDEGLANDHTDGHVDNLARFVNESTVVCQAPNGADDPNAAVLDAIRRTLENAADAEGHNLTVIAIPSPGMVQDEDGKAMAASHMNFIIGNKTVVVPVYNKHGAAGVKALAPLVPDRRVIGLAANAVLTGGGSFHCITQQEPA